MNGWFEIARGSKFFLDGRTVTFRKYFPGRDEPYLFFGDDGFPLTLSHDEVVSARDANQLVHWTKASSAIVRTGEQILRARKTCASATEDARAVVERRKDYVGAWVAARRPPRSRRYLLPIIETVYARRAAEAEIANRYEPRAPSVRRFQQLLKGYIERGEHADALVPQIPLRGNNSARLDRDVVSVIEETIDAFYLDRGKPSVAALHREVKNEIRLENKARAGYGVPLLEEPSYEAVNRAVGRLCEYTVVFCREGAREAKRRYRFKGSGLVTERANQIWEIDDTQVDLLCVGEDRKTPIGRPWMTVVIDIHTRMIMSFVVSFSPPDTHTAMEAMRLAIQRKAVYPTATPGQDFIWPAEGRPEALHVDNGKQYNSDEFKRGVTDLGIEHNTLPLLKPWFKGTVERLIGTVMRQVYHPLPGTTRANIRDRDKDEPPESVAAFTLADARARLLRWVVTEYQHRHHKGIEKSPYDMWRESVAKHALRMPPTTRDIDAALCVTVFRTLRHGVIECDGLHYLTPHGLLVEMADGSQTNRRVRVRRDFSDLTLVWFLDAALVDPAEEDWHEAAIIKKERLLVEGRTHAEYLIARQLRANNPAFAKDDPGWIASYAVAGSRLDSDAASGRLGPRRRAEEVRGKIKRQSERQLQHEVGSDERDDANDLQARFARLDARPGASPSPPAAAPAGTARPFHQEDSDIIVPRFRNRLSDDAGEDR